MDETNKMSKNQAENKEIKSHYTTNKSKEIDKE